MDAVRGVIMEVEDCAFPPARRNHRHRRSERRLRWRRHRGSGRRQAAHRVEWSAATCLRPTAAIFSAQGAALNAHASPDVKVLVVGNPANTNCLIAQRNAPDLDPRNFTAMMRLDHNRAKAQLAARTGAHVDAGTGTRDMGQSFGHPVSRHPSDDGSGQAAMGLVDQAWYADEFIPTVQQRGAAIIAARGASSAASAANAILGHIGDWVHGADDVVSMGVFSDGSYGIEAGLIYSFPVRCADGDWQIIDGLDISDFSREKMRATEAELQEERDAVAHLLP